MNAMILAAGMGTRLRPLTDHLPKALIEVEGKTLLQRVIERVKAAGARRIVINVHHLAERVEEFLRQNDYFHVDARVSSEREALLDTGGAILPASHLFIPGEHLLVHNVDILSDVDLRDLCLAHERLQSRATLVVHPPATTRLLRFDADGTLTGWEDRDSGARKIANERFHRSSPRSFGGIQVLSPAYIQGIYHRGAFSIIDEHLAQARYHVLRAYPVETPCIDMGTFPHPAGEYPR